MAANANQPPNANQQAWRSITPLNLAAPFHDFPKHPEKYLPKFDPGKGISIKDHLQSYYLALEFLDVQHEDIVCRIFPHTFEAKASAWFFSLQANSITDWNTFERVFESKFGIQRTIATLTKELLSLRIDKKEKVQDFNYRFNSHLINFSATTKTSEETLI